jgi:Predicted hydrolases or acyltransferases (alpha/beta hydrolase superfamily)
LQPILRNQVIAGYRYAKPLMQLMPSVFRDGQFTNYKHPTLLLIGENEVIYPAKKAIANANRLIPHIQAHIIPGASHSLTMEHADIVNEHTLRFLADHS